MIRWTSSSHWWRVPVAIALAAGLLLTGCGDDGDSEDASGDPVESDEEEPDAEAGDDLDVCALLTDDEIESLLGASLPSEPGSAGPYATCSWATGRLIVQVAQGDSIVLPPGRECPSIDIGDEAVQCETSVQFLSNGSRVIVQTIEDVTSDTLAAVARALLPDFE